MESDQLQAYRGRLVDKQLEQKDCIVLNMCWKKMKTKRKK